MLGVPGPVPCWARVERIVISTGHRFFGRHGKGALDYPAQEMDEADCVAGRGIRGDRFFDHPKDHKGQVTFFSMEVFDTMCRELGVHGRPPSVLRRNLYVRGIDLLPLVGAAFVVQGIVFEGVEDCRPCYWMEDAFGRGAEAFLKGRGGLRARVITSGILRPGAP